MTREEFDKFIFMGNPDLHCKIPKKKANDF